MATASYYEILGLPETASQEEIKQAYRMYSKKYHPDINSDPNAAAMFRLISDAYRALTSPQCEDSSFGTHEEPQDNGRPQTSEESSYEPQVKETVSIWRILLTPFVVLFRLVLVAIVWLLKFPVILAGMIGYILAALCGIGTVLGAIYAISGNTASWTMVLVCAILAIVLYVLTLLSGVLLGLLESFIEWLLGR